MRSDLLAASAVLLAAAALPLPSRAEPAPAAPDTMLGTVDVPTLKSWYLACDRASRQAPLDRPAAQGCSVVAEALRQRAFGGDFDRLIAWWQGARDNALAQAPR